MEGSVDTKCPACGVVGAFPHDAEGEDMFPCKFCGVSLVAKCVLEENDTRFRAWLTTEKAERALLDSLRKASS